MQRDKLKLIRLLCGSISEPQIILPLTIDYYISSFLAHLP